MTKQRNFDADRVQLRPELGYITLTGRPSRYQWLADLFANVVGVERVRISVPANYGRDQGLAVYVEQIEPGRTVPVVSGGQHIADVASPHVENGWSIPLTEDRDDTKKPFDLLDHLIEHPEKLSKILKDLIEFRKRHGSPGVSQAPTGW